MAMKKYATCLFKTNSHSDRPLISVTLASKNAALDSAWSWRERDAGALAESNLGNSSLGDSSLGDRAEKRWDTDFIGVVSVTNMQDITWGQ